MWAYLCVLFYGFQQCCRYFLGSLEKVSISALYIIYPNYNFELLIRHIFQSALHVCMNDYYWEIILKFLFFSILVLKIIDIKIFQYYMNLKTNSTSKQLSREKVEVILFSALYLSLFISCFCVNGIIQPGKTTPQVTFKG